MCSDPEQNPTHACYVVRIASRAQRKPQWHLLLLLEATGSDMYVTVFSRQHQAQRRLLLLALRHTNVFCTEPLYMYNMLYHAFLNIPAAAVADLVMPVYIIHTLLVASSINAIGPAAPPGQLAGARPSGAACSITC